MTDSWHSYPKIHAIGASFIVRLFESEVTVEEKVDGSQISFGSFDGELRIKSRGKDQTNAPDKMFQIAHDVISSLEARGDLVDGWTYSGEYLNKPKHNTLVYDRVPKGNIAIFDIRSGHEEYLPYHQKAVEAERLGFDVVPLLFKGKVLGVETLKDFLEHESFLGGPKIEGFVVKAYDQFTKDGKAMMGKFVSDAFKEKHRKDWKKSNPSSLDIIAQIGEELRTEARWRKAIERRRDNGDLFNEPKDIGPLIKSIVEDTWEEEMDYIKDKLWKYAKKHVERKLVAGFPEWYKNRLLEGAFSGNDS